MVTFIASIAFIVLDQNFSLELKSHEKVCQNKDFCGILMSPEKNSILEFNQYVKPDKKSYITYVYIESLI